MAYQLKTTVNDADVKAYIMSVENELRKSDALKLLDLFHSVTGEPPKMWGDSIIGFGTYHYKYASGHEGDWMATGFSPRKQNLSLYIMSGMANHHSLLEKLGKHKIGKSCLYINKLSDIDLEVLKELIHHSYQKVKSTGKGC